MMRKADGLCAVVALVTGALVVGTLFAVPAYGQTATVSRVDLVPEDPANASRVGSVLLQRAAADGDTFTVIGLANAVPAGSVLEFSRDGLDLGISRTASVSGTFPIPGESPTAIPYEEGTTIGLTIVDAREPSVSFSATFVANFSIATGDPHRLVSLVPVDAISGVTFGENNVLLTQREEGGLIVDEFEGLPGAVPEVAQVEVFSRPRDQVADENEWLSSRIHITRSVEFVGGGYKSSGNILPWSIPNLHYQQLTLTSIDPPLTLYPESKAYLRVTTREGVVALATIQDDVTVDFYDSNLSFVTNNERNPDGSFLLVPPVVARVVGPAGTVEPFSSVILSQEFGGETFTVGSTNVDSAGSAVVDVVPNLPVTSQDEISLDGIAARLEDRFGNVRVEDLPNPDQEAVIFETPIALPTQESPTPVPPLVGRVEGLVVEPASVVIVRADSVGGFTEGGPFVLNVIVAPDDGSVAFDVERSPTVDISVIDPTGNTVVIPTLEIDTEVMGSLADLTVTTAEEDPVLAAAGVVGHIDGAVEHHALVFIRADSVGGLTEGGPFLLDTFQAADDGLFHYDVKSSPTVDITLIDLAGNTKVLPNLVIDDAVEAANVDVVTLGFPTTTITGTAEPNAGIRVIGLLTITPEILQSANTGDVVDSLPAGVDSGAIGEAAADADGNFTVTLPGFASQVVYIQVVDLAGNVSNYTTVVLGHVFTDLEVGLVRFTELEFTNNPPGNPDLLNLRVVDAATGQPVPNIDVVGFADFEDGVFRNPITDIDFPSVTDSDGRLDFPLEIPDFDPNAVEFNFSTLLEQFYVVALDPATVDYIGARMVSAADGLDRVGPRIASVLPLIFIDEDLQLIQNGSEAPDILNVRNVLPNMATSGPRLPTDALNFIFIIANTNDEEEIDVWDTGSLEMIYAKGLDALMGLPYGLPMLPIPGASALNLGYNFWNPQAQKYSGHRVVFVALMDAAGNLSPDPVPIVLDVEIQDPDKDRITVGDGIVTAEDGAVEPRSYVSFFGDTTRTELLGVTIADSVGAFEALVDTSRDAVVVLSRDQAGNVSNPVNVKPKPVPVPPSLSVPFLVLDAFGAIHTPGGTVAGSPTTAASARSLAEAHDAPGVYYQLNANGAVAGPLGGTVAAPSVAGEDQILFNQNLARDLEIVSTEEGIIAGYLLAGNGFVGTFGDAPFYGDAVRDSISAANSRVTATSQRHRLDGSIFLEDSNGNGEYDIFQFETEDKNGNGILDPERVEFVPVDPNDPSKGVRQVVIPAEDVNGNGVLDIIFDAEGLFDASEVGIGFGRDLARDLEVIHAPAPAPGESPTAGPSVTGYMILDGWGVIHRYGTTPDLQNPRSSPGQDIFRAFELVTDGDGNISDIVVLNGLGQIYATPGGFLNAPAEDPGMPGGGGDLSFVLDPKPPFFGFDIARDIEINPIDTNEDGVVGDGGDGFYILDGYGGIHAVGAAPTVDNAPFLGFDIARDLDISKTTGGGISVPNQ